MKRMLTAIQPSNNLTLGNYLGAIKNFNNLQKSYDCFAFIADLHAITVKHDPKFLKEQTLKVLATYIAAGINPKTTTLFIQSHIHEHAELGWILNCYSYMGELGRMHQFKEKGAKQGVNVSVGLFDYPVLMAADILLYNVNIVPVGEDQKQHLELTRDIAQRFNNLYGDETFVIPEFTKPISGAKIMSLQDPTLKMSKSDVNNNATIFLEDSNDLIMKKFKKAVTDSGTEVTANPSQGVLNLIEIQSAITEKSMQDITNSYLGKQYGDLKKDTGDIVIAAVGPIRDETNRILKNEMGYIMRLISDSTSHASHIARQTLKKVKEKVGFVEKLILF